MKLLIGLCFIICGIFAYTSEIQANQNNDPYVSVTNYIPAGVSPTEIHLQQAINENEKIIVPSNLILNISNEILIPSNKEIIIDGILNATTNRPNNWSMIRIHKSINTKITGNGTLNSGTQVNTIYGIYVSGTSSSLDFSNIKINGFYSGIWSPADGAWRDNLRLKNISITNSAIAAALTSWRNGYVENIKVSNFTNIGIGTYNANGIKILGGSITNGGYTNSASAAISAELAPNAIISNVIIKDIEGHAVRVANKSHNLILENLNISNIGWLNGYITHGSSSGIAAMIGPVGGESKKLVFKNLNIDTVAGYGILVHPGLTADVKDNIVNYTGDPAISFIGSGFVTGNTITNPDGPGIVVGPDPDGGPYQSSYAIVSNNIISNSAMSGILLNGSPLNGIISNNLLINNQDGIVKQNWTWENQIFISMAELFNNVIIE